MCVVRVRDRGNVEQARNATAPRDIRLQAVDRFDHSVEVQEDVAVLTRSDFDARGTLLTHAPQPVEVVRRYRLLEPLDAALLRVDPRPFDRFLTCERAVRVDEELRVLTDRLPRRPRAVTIAAWLAPDLHLHPWDSLLRPTAELLLQLRVGIRREATATVDRHLVVDRVEHGDEGLLEQPRLQIPEREVDRGHRHESQTGAPDVAQGARHRAPRGPYLHRVATFDRVLQLVLDQLRRRRVRVRVAEPDGVVRVRFDDDDRRGVPLEGPVRLVLVRRNLVRGSGQLLDRGARRRGHATRPRMT